MEAGVGLEDEDPDVRRAAAEALRSRSEALAPAYVQLLAKHALDSGQAVRSAALAALEAQVR